MKSISITAVGIVVVGSLLMASLVHPNSAAALICTLILVFALNKMCQESNENMQEMDEEYEEMDQE